MGLLDVRLVVFNDYRIGTLETDGIHEITDLVDGLPADAGAYRVNQLISRFEELRPDVDERRLKGPIIATESVRLRPPTPRPRNFLAAPLNYVEHGAEMAPSLRDGKSTARELGFFVKAGGSLCGATDRIEVPDRPNRQFDHEAEIGVVIGREARSVSPDRALEHVFGYTLIIDVTMRMTDTEREERPMRKSFWTFAPCGPCLLTADEISDPSTLPIRLWVNGELRQSAFLRDLVVDVPELIAGASEVLPLEPGDLYATGTPAGVGPIRPGDVVVVESEPIGRMRLPVVLRDW
jgi:2-keto-4-pentenoate hydratase/2-oxohepta-3-ene-1,7-dioic acid hydratase in catechol pathway